MTENLASYMLMCKCEPTFALADFARRMVLLGINAAQDETDMKQRIMIARLDGHLTFEEAERMISERGLKHD